MRIAPLITRSPETNALRYVTDDLLAEVYLAPQVPDQNIVEHLGPGGPWSESFSAAPEETARAVKAGLLALAHATPRLDPSDVIPDTLPEGRARSHLTALRQLWCDLGSLPGPLNTWQHVLTRNASDALEPLPLVGEDCTFASPAEASLAKALRARHGYVDAGQATPLSNDGTALRHLQDNFGLRSEPTTSDASVSCYGLRDPREEAECAAALAQFHLDDGRADHPGEIGLLVPDGPTYELALQEAFDRVGLPLSGLPAQPVIRDGPGEVLSLLLVLLRGLTPRTALASLCIAPGMPWPTETGRKIAREVIDRGWSRTASNLTGPSRELLDSLRPCSTPEQLFARLSAIAQAAPEAKLHPRIAALKSVTSNSIDWPLLRRLATPNLIASEGHDRFVEGVSLFTESALPWRSVRQLIVLGMAGRHWPRLPGSDPFFTESEIAMIRDSGLRLEGREQRLGRGLELFRRQLSATTEGLTMLVPALDLRGDRLTPSTGLALIAQLLGAEEPTDLIQDPRSSQHGEFPVTTVQSDPVPLGGAPALPESGILHIQRGLGTAEQPGHDLLRLRDTPDGTPLPHSPSRLETLLVSPLGWLLDELGARELSWVPETLDVMTLGTLMHQVLEDIFTEGAPVPDASTLADAIPDVLEAAILRHAGWLAEEAWATERRSLLREALDICSAWATFLRETGAEVLHNEIPLAGEHGGLLLHGKADCLLKLPDGRILVVDHKRSSAGGRRDRMAKGWDLQVALYRAMLERPTVDTALTRLVADGTQVVTAYHMLRDGTVLSDADGGNLPRVEAVGDDASINAMEHLAEVLAEVGAGTIRLNHLSDSKTFDKERGIKKVYALDNPLVAAFGLPNAATEEDAQ